MNTVKLVGFVSLFAGVRICTAKEKYTYLTPAMKVIARLAMGVETPPPPATLSQMS